MAFSAKKFIDERLVTIEDELKQLLKQREATAESFDSQIKDLLLEREEWLNLRGDEPQNAPAKPAAKKAAAKK